ncbi:MAG: hypothetical protein NDF55_04610 [archaeon GB-1867-005]|nr:hypothetical protein [Candidatus Culexmicrobium cathedralense]
MLKSLVSEYKLRFVHVAWKILLRKLAARLVTGSRGGDLTIKCREGNGTVTLEIRLSEKQVKGMARSNVTQLWLLALRLMTSS